MSAPTETYGWCEECQDAGTWACSKHGDGEASSRPSPTEAMWLWRAMGPEGIDEWWGTIEAPDKTTARIRLRRRLPEYLEAQGHDCTGDELEIAIWQAGFFVVAEGYL